MENRESKGIRIMCLVIFLTFTLSWLMFFQRDLLSAAMTTLSSDRSSSYACFFVSVLLIFLVLLPVPIINSIFKFRNGLYAANYTLSAFMLGAFTGYDGNRFFGQSGKEWIISVCFVAAIFIFSVIKSFSVRSNTPDNPRKISDNLLIMTLLFCLAAFLGNTDENLHRKLRIERYLSKCQYEKALQVGCNEEETDSDITLLRAKAMLLLDADNPGSGTGEHLFAYPIREPKLLSLGLSKLLSDPMYDNVTVNIARALVDCDIYTADSLIMPFLRQGRLPAYYMQVLVLNESTDAAARFPEEFAKEKERFDLFVETLERMKNDPMLIRANSTYKEYGKTYYWYYEFRHTYTNTY